ncbi:hypothetical protein ABMD26_001938 [Pseudomonas sp. PvP001]
MAPQIAYNKHAKAPLDLLAHLEAKGLAVPQPERALHALQLIGYYRLLIYMRPLQSNRDRLFFSGVEFDDILALYDFDRQLRLICLDAVERIEVAMRAAIINTLAGPHFYLDSAHFINTQAHASFMRAATDPTTCKHQAVEHYLDTYDSPPYPPIWVILEATTFGPLSYLYASLLLPYQKSHRQSLRLRRKDIGHLVQKYQLATKCLRSSLPLLEQEQFGQRTRRREIAKGGVSRPYRSRPGRSAGRALGGTSGSDRSRVGLEATIQECPAQRSRRHGKSRIGHVGDRIPTWLGYKEILDLT